MIKESFPVTESTLSVLHLGQLLKQQYGLSSQTECRLFRTGMNHLYQVRDGDQKFVLRIYTFNWRNLVDITEEIRLLLHLRKNGISASYPIPDSRNKYVQEINAPEGLRYGVLFSYAEGTKMPKFDIEASHNTGVAMAKMHLVTEKLNLHRIGYNPDTLLKASLARTKSFFRTPSAEMAFVEQLTAYLINEYEKVDANRMRHGAVHMDIWFDNMHFKDDKEVTFFDFDFCGNAWLCHDISYFLYQLYNTNLDEREYSAKAKGFLEGYESVKALSPEEKRTLPFLCLAVMLFYLSMQCDRYDTWSNIFLNEEHLKRFIGALKRWMALQDIIDPTGVSLSNVR